MKFIRFFIIIGLFGSASLLLYLLIIMIFNFVWQGKIFPISPECDTEYAIHFDKNKFDQIELGMNYSEVQNLVGSPISRSELNHNIENNGYPDNCKFIFHYSQDGNCNWGNFAWFNYAVFLDAEYCVVKIIKGTTLSD